MVKIDPKRKKLKKEICFVQSQDASYIKLREPKMMERYILTKKGEEEQLLVVFLAQGYQQSQNQEIVIYLKK